MYNMYCRVGAVVRPETGPTINNFGIHRPPPPAAAAADDDIVEVRHYTTN
jgi:hypothetical protein